MASGKSCPDCGSSNLVDDSLYSQSQLVCADCGSVVSEGLLTTTRSEEIQGTDVRYRESTVVDKQPCRNQIQGLRRVRALCRILRFPRVMEETAESLFGRAYEHPSFLNVSLQKKEVLAGSCVLLSSRQHHWPITMGTIYSLLEASEHAIGMVYLELVKILNVEAPPNRIEDLLESHCHQYKLGPSDVPEVFSESTARLVERTAGLVELAADTWLVTGRHPVHVLVGAVYLAWLSLNPCRARLGTTLARFCRMAKVCLPGKAALRVLEMKEVLCQLARELPWLRGAPVDSRTVPTLTGDILKHRVLLMRKAMQNFENQLEQAEPPACPPPACPPPACPPPACLPPACPPPACPPPACPPPACPPPACLPPACPPPACPPPACPPPACPPPACLPPACPPPACPPPACLPPAEAAPPACPPPACLPPACLPPACLPPACPPPAEAAPPACLPPAEAAPPACPPPAEAAPPACLPPAEAAPPACPPPAEAAPPACPPPAEAAPPACLPPACPPPAEGAPPACPPPACPPPAEAAPPACPPPAEAAPPACLPPAEGAPPACPPPAEAAPPACPPPAEGAPHSEPRHEAPIRSAKSPTPALQMQASDWLSREGSRFNTECPLSQPPPSGLVNPIEKAVTCDLDAQDGGEDPVPENGWAKRHLFVPPCTRNPPKKRRMEHFGPAVTGYEEISDSEIEGYLRTPQEMHEFEELQRRLMPASDS